MLDGIVQWLTQNGSWLYPLAALITILTGVGIYFKPVRWAISKLWSSLSRSFKTGAKRPRFTLHFVARDFPYCYWGIGSQGDKPITCIVTKWHVTQAPGSGLPVRLLKAHLLKPPLAKYLIHSQVIMGVIPEGQTRDVTIHFNLSEVLKPEMQLKVHLAVEDQLANKHKLPPILVKPLPTGK